MADKESSERSAGDVLDGRYRLIERLGEGGFGDVWRAEELLPDGMPLREVALKLLKAHVAQSSEWTEEARIIASLRHPALVTIYAAGLLNEPDRQLPFVAMELLIGESLAAYVEREEQVAWRRVLAWARQAAAALDEIHRAGVVHLDLKPANLFLVEDGGIRVLDFGIARQGRGRGPVYVTDTENVDEMSTAAFMVAHESAQRQADKTSSGTGTMSHTVMGTPGFMAPEIFEGGEATPASDAYALASCIVQLTTGRLPQQITDRPAKDAKTRMQAWISDVQSATVRGLIRDLNAEPLPAALKTLLERWLMLDPAARDIEQGSLREQLDVLWQCPQGPPVNPYRGLAPYGIEDEGRLFGRDSDTHRVAHELAHHPCVVLQGASGIGLRSLALAGLVPALGRASADDREDWCCCLVHLDDDPDAALQRSLDGWLDEQGQTGSPLGDGGGEDEHEQEDDAQADRLLGRLRTWAASSKLGVAVVLDDLHALLEAKTVDQVMSFAAALAGGIEGVRLIATLREEHTEELLKREPIGSALRPWLRFMSPPPMSAARDIVCGPALLVGAKLEGVDSVVDEIQRELAADGRRLPLVSMALQMWWQRAEGELPTAASYEELGGVAGAMAAKADTVMASLGEEGRKVANTLLLRMITADGDLLQVPQRELVSFAERPADARAALAELVAARLVWRRGGDLRIGHPALVERWTHLHDLRLHDIDRLTFLEQLREAARRWVTSGHNRRELWSADRLRELRRRYDELREDLGADERAFVLAVRAAARTRWLIRAAVSTCVIAVVVAAFWFEQTMAERARQQQVKLEQARKAEAVGRMVTRSRRTTDPYVRVALLAKAIERGSHDPVLPLELLSGAHGLLPAQFLTLESVAQPSMPWGERWLLGGRGAVASIFDFQPPGGKGWAPLHHRFRAHAQGMYDFQPFAFDTAFVSRGLDGELRVWRLRDDGAVVLAAVSPMKCVRGLGALQVAARAPVVACPTEAGVARWDLRAADKVKVDAFKGRPLHLSADGRWLAATRRDKLLLWNADAGERTIIEGRLPPIVARFSPRDEVVAVVRQAFGAESDRPAVVELLELPSAKRDQSTEPRRLKRFFSYIREPASAHWAPSGVDLAVCNASAEGRWYYLRKGERPAADGPAPKQERACRTAGKTWPKKLKRILDYGDDLGRSLGPRRYQSGWRLEDGRLLTQDLVMFDPNDKRLARLLQFRDDGGKVMPLGSSAAAVIRLGDDRVAWQVDDTVRIYDNKGHEHLERKGRLLAYCPDGRLLAWRRAGDSKWALFEALHDTPVVEVMREPGFVLGADPGCHRVLFQFLDGTLASVELDDKSAPVKAKPLASASGSYALDGYVYDLRPSLGGERPAPNATVRGETVPVGVWLAFSGGAIVRVDGPTGRIRPYGHASPRATTMADGPLAGDLVFADDTGVKLRLPGGSFDRLLRLPRDDRQWQDIRVLPGGHTALLAWAHGVIMLDLARGDVLGELETRERGRMATWDKEGSVLLWPFSFQGRPRGDVIPISPALVRRVAKAASNLIAKQQKTGHSAIRLSQPTAKSR